MSEAKEIIIQEKCEHKNLGWTINGGNAIVGHMAKIFCKTCSHTVWETSGLPSFMIYQKIKEFGIS